MRDTLRWRKRLAAFYKAAETLAKIIATVTALIAALAFVWPWFGGWVNQITARRFGVEGHVFYEVIPDPSKANPGDKAKNPDMKYSLTDDGNFYAPQSKTRDYNAISVGDILQADSSANLHEQPSHDSPYIYILEKKDCVLVLEKEGIKKPQPNYSNGWLKVVTAACGLFK